MKNGFEGGNQIDATSLGDLFVFRSFARSVLQSNVCVVSSAVVWSGNDVMQK